MKKLLLLGIALSLGLGLKAQCSLNQAVDFTATDIHGEEIHLFDILDGGQYVLIDFFFTSCGPCQQATPKVVQSYHAMGCNMHDVFYMEISCMQTDNNSVCQNWCQTYGVEYPTISGPGGGVAICGSQYYNIPQYPTVILIAPDRTILIHDLWPINNAQTIISQLEGYGLQQHDCNPPAGELTITPDTLWYNQMGEQQTFTISNETDETVTIEDVIPEGGSALEIWEPWFPYTLEPGASVDVVVGLQVPPTKEDFSPFLIDVMTSAGDKQVVAMVNNEALDHGLILFPYFMVELTPETPSLELYLTNGNSGTLNPIEILSIEETNECGAPFLNIELPSDLPYTLNHGEQYSFTISPLYEGGKGGVGTSIKITCNYGTQYYSVSIDEALLTVTEIKNVLSLFPNPANERVTVKGEYLGTVTVYNALGQKVETFSMDGTDLNINTSGYENGVYVVKAGEKTLRFVVKH